MDDIKQRSIDMTNDDAPKQYAQLPPGPQWIVDLVEQAFEFPGKALSIVKTTPPQQ
jgi:hypothetical protein